MYQDISGYIRILSGCIRISQDSIGIIGIYWHILANLACTGQTPSAP